MIYCMALEMVHLCEISNYSRRFKEYDYIINALLNLFLFSPLCFISFNL